MGTTTRNLALIGRGLAAVVVLATRPVLGQTGTYVPPVPGAMPAGMAERDVFDRSRIGPENVPEIVASERGRLVVAFIEWGDAPKAGLMRATAWSDPEVIAWAKDHARVLDVVFQGEQPDPLMERWHVSQNPTTIVFRDGAEVDRAVGYRGTGRLLEFLRGAASGETTSVRLEKSLAGVREGSWKATGSQRLALARDLLEASRVDEAAEQFEWLWENLMQLDPSMERVRRSTLVMDLKELCKQRAASREVFAAKRDAVEAKLREDATWDLLADWLALNRALGDDERSLAWFDRVKVHPDAPGTLERFADQLKPMLQERGEARQAELILMYSHPERILANDYEEYRQTKQELEDQMRAAAGDKTGASEMGAAFVNDAAKATFSRRMSRYYCELLKHDRTMQAQMFAETAKSYAIGGELLHLFADEVMNEDLPLEHAGELLESAGRLGRDTSQSMGRLKTLQAR